jgi:carbamoyl-phosphate synthase large subunit
MNICRDKWETNYFLRSNGFYYPQTFKEEDYKEVGIEFPVLIKPCIGDSSKGVQIVDTKEDLKPKLDEIFENKYTKTKSKMIIQEYLKGPEYTTSTLVLDGKCVGVLTLEKEMRYPGHTTKAKVYINDELDSYIAKIAEKLNPMGPANFQFKIQDGMPMIFEINARFSGTSPTCSLIGFNTVEACLRHYILKEPIQKLEKKEGTMLRYFNEVFIPEEEIVTLTKDKYLSKSNSINNISF